MLTNEFSMLFHSLGFEKETGLPKPFQLTEGFDSLRFFVDLLSSNQSLSYDASNIFQRKSL